MYRMSPLCELCFAWGAVCKLLVFRIDTFCVIKMLSNVKMKLKNPKTLETRVGGGISGFLLQKLAK